MVMFDVIRVWKGRVLPRTVVRNPDQAGPYISSEGIRLEVGKMYIVAAEELSARRRQEEGLPVEGDPIFETNGCIVREQDLEGAVRAMDGDRGQPPR